jgi:hypothetical protein
MRWAGDGEVSPAVGDPDVGADVGPTPFGMPALSEPPQPASASAETATYATRMRGVMPGEVTGRTSGTSDLRSMTGWHGRAVEGGSGIGQRCRGYWLTQPAGSAPCAVAAASVGGERAALIVAA